MGTLVPPFNSRERVICSRHAKQTTQTISLLGNQRLYRTSIFCEWEGFLEKKMEIFSVEFFILIDTRIVWLSLGLRKSADVDYLNRDNQTWTNGVKTKEVYSKSTKFVVIGLTEC